MPLKPHEAPDLQDGAEKPQNLQGALARKGLQVGRTHSLWTGLWVKTLGIWSGPRSFEQDARSLGRTHGLWAGSMVFGSKLKVFGCNSWFWVELTVFEQDPWSVDRSHGLWAGSTVFGQDTWSLGRKGSKKGKNMFLELN